MWGVGVAFGVFGLPQKLFLAHFLVLSRGADSIICERLPGFAIAVAD